MELKKGDFIKFNQDLLIPLVSKGEVHEVLFTYYMIDTEHVQLAQFTFNGALRCRIDCAIENILPYIEKIPDPWFTSVPTTLSQFTDVLATKVGEQLNLTLNEQSQNLPIDLDFEDYECWQPGFYGVTK